MKLRCKKEALYPSGKKIMHFTKGEIYEFEKSIDPPGWTVLDDYGNEEVFFRTEAMFEPI